MKKIVLFGAGKSATVLIDYLLQNAATENWQLVVIDADLNVAQSKIKSSPFGTAVSFDIIDAAERKKHIVEAAIVISLLPPALHFLIAKDCVALRKNLLTASYVDDAMQSIKKQVEENDLLFLCEMGLDPGIDHMSAKSIIDDIENEGGKTTSFISHCGGLVALESDDNPWHYKISWNPRNVITAGKNGTLFKEDGQIKTMPYEALFAEKRFVEIPQYGTLCWYPNRNSLPYMEMYNLQECQTFIRTTLRHPDFIDGWQKIIELHLTDDKTSYNTNGKTARQFFEDYIHSAHKKPSQFSPQFLKQMAYLGFADDTTEMNKGVCSAADILQSAMEKNLTLLPNDKDLVIMLHDIQYQKENSVYQKQSTLIVKGVNNQYTAMAKTVGLPLGIVAKLILNNTIRLKGLQIPTGKEIYQPVLQELKQHQIEFTEAIKISA